MKHLITLLLLASQFIALAQASEHAGNYEFYRGDNDSHFLKDKLTLNPNGTFLFSSESYIEERMERRRMQYGKGTWRSENKLIFLSVDNSDIDAKHELDLNNTRLRFDTKSPRDKSDRDIKTSVRIIDCEVSSLKGRTLIKDADTKAVIKEKDCCKSVWQVHSYLQGKWKGKNEPNKEYHYSFKNENGVFNVYEVNDSGDLIEVNGESTKVRIIKSESGFKIEYNFDLNLDVIYDIKHLDSNKLILVRRDGKESTLVRILK